MHQNRPVPLAATLALAVAMTACGDQPHLDPRTEVPRVRAFVVQDAGAAARSFTGTVAARVQSDLGFRIAGKVQERLVDTGQIVQCGQPLLRIDPIDLNLAVEAQREVVAAAQARAQQTAEDEVRYRDLRRTGVISNSAYNLIKVAADSAQAQLRAAQAQAEVAVNASRYAELVADADGMVVETLAEPGQVVAAGQIVVRLAHAGPREAVVHLPETLRPAIGSEGQAALFGREGLRVRVKLRQLSDAADRQTRTFEARFVLDGELTQAPLGSTVTIQIPDRIPSSQKGMLVPISALFDAGKGPGIWVISGEPASVSWRPTTVLRLDDEIACLTGPINPGEQVVALGAHLLREGEVVRVIGEATAATGATEGSRP